jgi:hypothetical protein
VVVYLFLGLIEVAQIGRRLTLLERHQIAVSVQFMALPICTCWLPTVQADDPVITAFR